MRNILFLFAFFICFFCNAQELQIDSCQTEKYDFKRFKNKCCELIERPDKWRVSISELTYCEYPPDSSYYFVLKRFYPNGNLKEKGKLIPSTLKIGIWHYYDEQGCLIATVDEDACFGKVKPEDLLNFAKRRQDPRDNDVYYNVIAKYESGRLREIKSAGSLRYNVEERVWLLKINKYPGRVTYRINGDTGEVITLTVDYFDGTGKSHTVPSILDIFDDINKIR